MQCVMTTLEKLEKDKERSMRYLGKLANASKAIVAFRNIARQHRLCKSEGDDGLDGLDGHNDGDEFEDSGAPMIVRTASEHHAPPLLPKGSRSQFNIGEIEEVDLPSPSGSTGRGRSGASSSRPGSAQSTSSRRGGSKRRSGKKKKKKKRASSRGGNAGDSSGGESDESGRGSNPGSRSGSRAGRPRRRSRVAADLFGEEGEEEKEAVETFIEELFEEYAGSKDNKGRPLMNGSALRSFFRDFVMSSDVEFSIVQADFYYAEHLERQRDMSWVFDLSKSEAVRGLCMKSFCLVLKEVLPSGLAHNTARTHFHDYSGSAHAMHMHLSGGEWGA